MPRSKRAASKKSFLKAVRRVAKPRKVIKRVAKPVVEKVEIRKPSPTFLGEGPLSGEYRFAEISGSIAASSKERAIEKAQEIFEKHPNLVK